MGIVTGLLLALIALFAIVWIGWRYSSRVTSAPCPSYLAWMLELNWRTNATLAELELAPGMRVVDVGCGPGRLTVPIAQAVGPEGEVVALDMQQKMLELLARKIARTGLQNIRSIHGGAGAGLLPTAHFDRAVLVTVLGEIPDREGALREIHAALKPGGFLYINETIGDPHYQTQRKVRELAAACGLDFEIGRSGLFSYTARLHRRAA